MIINNNNIVMYKLFSNVNFIQTNEREHKLFYKNNSKGNYKRIDSNGYYKRIDRNKLNLFNKNQKKKSCEDLFLNIMDKKLRMNWRPFHKRRPYFSKPRFLISKHDYYLK